MITSYMKGLSPTAQSKHPTEKEAFLGGFPNLPKAAQKADAEQFIGETLGFVEVSVLDNVCNLVFIKFSAAEHMETLVVERCEKAEAEGRRLKANMPPGTLARKHVIWQVKQRLIQAFQLPEKSERVISSRRYFWLVSDTAESVKDIREPEGDNKITWGPSAPEPLQQEE